MMINDSSDRPLSFWCRIGWHRWRRWHRVEERVTLRCLRCKHLKVVDMTYRHFFPTAMF
jgi:hypothetical protein